MRISQSTLFYLCCVSFLVGLLLALLYDFLYMTRLWLMPGNKRYTVMAIQKLRAARIKEGRSDARKGIRAVLFLDDVFFCLVVALAIILVLYWLNNGAFRAAAPLCMVLGFGLFRATLSKGVRIVLQWFAFGVETVLYMLLMPFKRLFAYIAKLCQKSVQKQRQKRLFKQRQANTKQALQNIERTAQGLLPIYANVKIQKGEGRARKSKKAV